MDFDAPLLFMLTRQQLREHHSKKRRELSSYQQSDAADELCKKLLQLSNFIGSQNIGFYQATRGEIDPQGLLQYAIQKSKNCYLPVLHPEFDSQLHFLAYHAGDKLILNRFKILEPEFQAEKIIDLQALDLVFVPLLAFDKTGNRIGSGAGYYDRSFSFLLTRQRPTKPYLIGLAYEWQGVEQIAAKPWDVPLDAVATEKEIYLFRS